MAGWFDIKKELGIQDDDEERGTGIWRYINSSHVVAILWDRKEQDSAQQEIQERLNKMAGQHTRDIQSSHRYGDLLVAFESKRGMPEIYKYYNVPYQTYYYLWKLTPSAGHYIYFYLTRQHTRKYNNPASYRAACPYRYEKVGDGIPQN